MILADPNPVFQPAMRIISDITNANPAAVTTTFAHQYTTGIIARLNIPKGFGMVQANQLYGPINVTGATTFTIDIDSTNFGRFMSPYIVTITDIFGNASGILTGSWALVGLGQTFTIGDQLFTVVTKNGALQTDGAATGTMNMTTGAYDFIGADTLEDIFFNPVGYPDNQQYATVTALGEINSLLNAAERNVLPFSESL